MPAKRDPETLQLIPPIEPSEPTITSTTTQIPTPTGTNTIIPIPTTSPPPQIPLPFVFPAEVLLGISYQAGRLDRRTRRLIRPLKYLYMFIEAGNKDVLAMDKGYVTVAPVRVQDSNLFVNTGVEAYGPVGASRIVVKGKNIVEEYRYCDFPPCPGATDVVAQVKLDRYSLSIQKVVNGSPLTRIGIDDAGVYVYDFLHLPPLTYEPQPVQGFMRIYARGDDLYTATPAGRRIKVTARPRVFMSRLAQSVQVTSTTPSLVHEYVAGQGRERVIAWLNPVHVEANNPSGSGVTLYFSVAAIYSELGERTVGQVSVAEGSTAKRNIRVPGDSLNDGEEDELIGVRVYAWVSGTPATAPTIDVVTVSGSVYG